MKNATRLDTFHCEWNVLDNDKRVQYFIRRNSIITSYVLMEKVDPILSMLTGKDVSFYVPRYNINVIIPIKSFCDLWKTFRNFFLFAFGSVNPWLSKKEIYEIYGHDTRIYNFFNMARSRIRQCEGSLDLAICLLQIKANGVHKGYSYKGYIDFDLLLHAFIKEHPDASLEDVFYKGIQIGKMNI